ncbi:MAG: RNA polymerase sigma factor [Bacteroidota bacterium]|nr:RNA polymerase sigma factor [Bacteroidota bacterium]
MQSEIDKIVEGCIKGDKACQKLLYKRLSPKLMGVCTRYIRSRVEAEDCLQESFIKIFSSLSNYKKDGVIEAWARRITVNTLLNYLEKNKKYNFHSDIDETIEMESISLKQPNNIESEELIMIINQLPELYKVIFNLHAIEGYSHKEISVQLNIPESTSRSYLSRAKEMLVKMHEKINSIANEKVAG